MADTADLVVLGAYFGTGSKGMGIYLVLHSLKCLQLTTHSKVKLLTALDMVCGGYLQISLSSCVEIEICCSLS